MEHAINRRAGKKMEKYFNIRYEFDKRNVHERIAQQLQSRRPGYICVADGVILNIVNRNEDYRKVVDNSMFALCDSSYVPLYIRWIYGHRYSQYCGSQIFQDLIASGKYRMAFLGASSNVLNGLKQNLTALNPQVENMLFYELPFLDVEDFDYPAIAKMVEDDGAEIIWVALGAPKQEIFMNRLQPHLKQGVMIAVGAAFKFFSGTDVKRAPDWMVRNHAEFIYRIFTEPKKQIRRCYWIIRTIPGVLWEESKRKRRRKQSNENNDISTSDIDYSGNAI